MEALKKHLAVLLEYYDKIILGVLLAGLAGVMIQQSCSMQSTIEDINSKKPFQRPPTGRIGELDMDQFDMQIDVDPANTWQPVYRVERDDTFKIADISVSLRTYLLRHGETSLYDPAVYVYSSHKQDYIVHYDTKINPVTGLPEATGTVIDIENPIEDPNKPPVVRDNGKLIERLRLHKVKQLPFPAILRRITPNDPTDKSTWLAQIDVYEGRKKKSVFKRLGDSFPVPGQDGEFKIIDMDYQKIPDRNNIPKEKSSIIIRQGDDGERMTLDRGRALPLGKANLSLVVLPPLATKRNPYSINTEINKSFSLTFVVNGRTQTGRFSVVEERDGVYYVSQVGSDDVSPIAPFDPRELDKYRRQTPTTVDPQDPTMPMNNMPN